MNKYYLALITILIITIIGCHKKDTIDPTITLVGSSIIKIPLNSSWTEPGFTATDDQDKDLTQSVTVEGTVNINLSGSYKLTYTVTDLSGNESSAERIVTVYNEATYLSGKYAAHDSTSSSTNITYTATITTSTTKNKEFYIQNFGGWNAKCNCNAFVKVQVADTIQGSAIVWSKQIIHNADSLHSSPGGAVISTSPLTLAFTYSWSNASTQETCTGLYIKQ